MPACQQVHTPSLAGCPQQVSLADLQAVAASLHTAAPLLGLPVISTTSGAAQQGQALALSSLVGIKLFK